MNRDKPIYPNEFVMNNYKLSVKNIEIYCTIIPMNIVKQFNNYRY